MSITAMKKAREGLKAARHGHCDHAWADEAIADLDAAIEAAEKQEPVAWAVFEGRNAHDLYLPQEYDEALKMAGYKGDHAEVKPLHTTQPAAQPAPVHDQLAWQNLRNRIKADIDRTEGRWGMHGHSAVDNDYFTALEWVVERMDEILASAHRQPLIDVQWLEDAYLAGFMNSDEGHNGEYPFRYREENPLEDRRWLEAKNAYISAAIAAAKEKPNEQTNRRYETG